MGPKRTMVSTISDIIAKRTRNRSNAWRIFIPITPVPASRPRVARNGGVHYGKSYEKFRKEARRLIQEWDMPPEFPLDGPLAVSVSFYLIPPKKPKNIYPKGDVDNYFKTLDAFNNVVWVDDSQIVWENTTKQYREIEGIELEVGIVERIPKTRALPKVWVEG